MADIPLENARPNVEASRTRGRSRARFGSDSPCGRTRSRCARDARLAEGGGLKDRSDNGAGRVIGRLPGMDGERLESELRIVTRH